MKQEEINQPVNFDGAIASTINDAVNLFLDEFIEKTKVIAAIVVYSNVWNGNTTVLGQGPRTETNTYLPNELIELSYKKNQSQRTDKVNVKISSRGRNLSIYFDDAICIPFEIENGRGYLVYSLDSVDNNLHIGSSKLFISKTKKAIALGLEENSLINNERYRLATDYYENLRTESKLSITKSILMGATNLFKSSSSYISFPEKDKNTFWMADTIHIKTAKFKNLIMGEGQGLGGLVREKKSSASVIDYQQDDRIGPGAHTVTRSEGLISAMAAPLFQDETVAGILYVADRSIRPFSNSDHSILERYLNYCLGIEKEKKLAEIIAEKQAERAYIDMVCELQKKLNLIFSETTKNMHDAVPFIDDDRQELFRKLERIIDDSRIGTFINQDLESQNSYTFSNRDTQICEMLVTGSTNFEISKAMYMSIHTVKFHLANLFDSTGKKNREELLAHYLMRNLRMHNSVREFLS
jgi:DNA-binding CsgD family transcriptional regulator